MKISLKLIAAVVTAVVALGAVQAVAPAAASASAPTAPAAAAPPTSICKDARFNWRVSERIVDGGYVTVSLYSSSHTAACLKSWKKNGVRSNFLFKVTRHMKDGTKRKHRIQLLNRKVAWKAFGKVGKYTDVAVYAAPVPKTLLGSKAKVTLRF